MSVSLTIPNQKKIGTWRNHLLSTNVEIIRHESSSDVLPVGGIYDLIQDADVVYHLWGLLSSGSYQLQNRYAIKSRYTNFMEALNLLLACRETSVSRIVQVSKNIAIEEMRTEEPVEEGYLDLSAMNYEKIQYNIEELSRNFLDIYGLPIVTVRAHYAFGPRQGRREIIPDIIDQMEKGKRTILIKGVNISGEFTYISDVVHGMLLAGSTPQLIGKKFELTTGQKTLYSELANMISVKFGVDVQVVFDAEEKTAEHSSGGNLTRDEADEVHKIPGWAPTVQLDEGLNRMIDWMRRASHE